MQTLEIVAPKCMTYDVYIKVSYYLVFMMISKYFLSYSFDCYNNVAIS